MLSKPDAQYPVLSKIEIWWNQLSAIVESDLRKLFHDPTELLTRIVQPIVWLLIFGQAMSKIRAIPTGGLPYLDFIAPGILAQGVLFMSIFYGVSLIWERDAGTLHKILITPAPRILLVAGRAIACGIRGIFPVVVVYALSYFLGLNVSFAPLNLLGVLLLTMLGGALFSTFSFIIALIVKKRERFMGIGQLMTLPLFFASNALYPIDLMPGWIQTLSHFNPLTYQVDALRALMIVGQKSYFGLAFDFAILTIVFAILLLIASRFYPRILY
jgi:ABC-2 type transport system permease protein